MTVLDGVCSYTVVWSPRNHVDVQTIHQGVRFFLSIDLHLHLHGSLSPSYHIRLSTYGPLVASSQRCSQENHDFQVEITTINQHLLLMSWEHPHSMSFTPSPLVDREIISMHFPSTSGDCLLPFFPNTTSSALVVDFLTKTLVCHVFFLACGNAG